MGRSAVIIASLFSVILGCVVGYVLGQDRTLQHTGPFFPGGVLGAKSSYSASKAVVGPIEVDDLHPAGKDPNGMPSLSGIVKNVSDNEILLQEISVVDANSVLYDDQKSLLLEPGEFYAVVLNGTSSSAAPPDGHDIIIGYRSKNP